MTRVALVAAVVFALTAGNAGAEEIRTPQLTEALELASGQATVDVSCEADVEAWDAEARARGVPGDRLYGYTNRETRKVRLAPWVCLALTPSSVRFGWALHVIAGEAGRVAGIHDDGLNGCFGLVWAADLAARVWSIPAAYVPGGSSARVAAAFPATQLGLIVAQALDMHRRFYAPPYRTVCA